MTSHVSNPGSRVSMVAVTQITKIYTYLVVHIEYCMRSFYYYIVEQVTHYYHSKFHSDTNVPTQKVSIHTASYSWPREGYPHAHKLHKRTSHATSQINLKLVSSIDPVHGATGRQHRITRSSRMATLSSTAAAAGRQHFLTHSGTTQQVGDS